MNDMRGSKNHTAWQYDPSFNYRMLSRLKKDCEYFLGNGSRYEPHLWAGSIDAHIAKMRELYALVPKKPVWLTEADIDLYERDMKGEYRPGDVLQIGADDDISEYRVISTVKSVPNERGIFVTMYGFHAYWDRGLEHFKFSNTSRLPRNERIRIIGYRPVKW